MRNILETNDPLLRLTAEPIPQSEFNSDWLKALVKELTEIMAETGAVGIAAPQIGVSKRLIIFSTSYTKRRKPEVHILDTVLINPTFKNLSDEIELGYEGCLNTGEIMGKVPRSPKIEYSGYSLDGQFITKQAEGFEARIVQHEIDHLNGVLFIDRIEDKETLTTYQEMQKEL